MFPLNASGWLPVVGARGRSASDPAQCQWRGVATSFGRLAKSSLVIMAAGTDEETMRVTVTVSVS